MKTRIALFLIFTVFLFATPLVAGSLGGPGTYLGDGNDILFQGFTWESVKQMPNYWSYLAGQIPQIAASGASLVWIPPSADSVDRQGYLPREWYKQSNAYGTEMELLNLIAGFRESHIKVIADIVVDHRCGDKSVFDFQNPTWTDICGVITEETNKCGYGSPATGDTFHGPPGINHLNVQVQSDIKKYLYWMDHSIGYSGFRWDTAKGFSPRFVKEYLDASVPYFSVGEYWDGNKDHLEHWVVGTGGSSAVFDYALKYVLNRSVGAEDYAELNDAGKINGLVGIDPAHAVTFVENHDTAYGATAGDSNNMFPQGKEMEGYAFILTHPGCPTIFYGHYFGTVPISLPVLEEQQAIQALVQIRRRNKINALSKVEILRAREGLYAAVVDDRVAVKIGPDTWSPPGGSWRLASSGKNYKVWEKG